MNFLLPLAALLASCTLYERMFGTEIVHAHIYDALWFHTLWGIVFVYACMEDIKRKIWKRPLIALLHVAFVLIAVGYAFTCYTPSEANSTYAVALRQPTILQTTFALNPSPCP